MPNINDFYPRQFPSYRKSSPPPPDPPEPPQPFNKRHPHMHKAVKELKYFGIGTLTLTLAIGLFWALFPGAYYLGIWIGNSVFHWNVATSNTASNNLYPLSGWLIGIVPIVFPVASFVVGCMFKEQ